MFLFDFIIKHKNSPQNFTMTNLQILLFHNFFIKTMLLCSQIKASTPVLMCSVPGYDASGRVDDLATELGKQLTSIAIGTCWKLKT